MNEDEEFGPVVVAEEDKVVLNEGGSSVKNVAYCNVECHTGRDILGGAIKEIKELRAEVERMKEFMRRLAESHSRLSQAEYMRNPAINDESPIMKIEREYIEKFYEGR